MPLQVVILSLLQIKSNYITSRPAGVFVHGRGWGGVLLLSFYEIVMSLVLAMPVAS
jgi:hypothetical protein